MARRTTVRLIAGGVAALLTSALGGLAVLPSAVAAGCASVVPGDVNGDGHAEVAVSEDGAAGAGRGAVHVLYGKASGLVADRSGAALDDQYLDQASPGVPGTSENGDRWGAATAFGDFNGDGCADLAVGVPGENAGEGAITVLYGSASGITAAGAQTFTLARLVGLTDSAALGATLVVADLDDDGTDDLAAGAPSFSTGGADGTGAVVVLYGDADGLAATGDLLDRSTPGVPGDPTANDYFGSQLTAGDFDGDGVAELAVGMYGAGTGGVQTLERGAAGYGNQQPALITRSTPGVPAGDGAWPASLAAGDFNADGRDDLAVGDPDEGCLECDEEYGYGSVVVLPGSTNGLTGVGSTVWTQDSPGVVGTAVPDDGFGFSVAAGPLDDDTIDDLVVGTPSDRGYTGSVTFLRGSTSGLTTAGAGGALYTQATRGVAGSVGPNGFGQTLAVAYVHSGVQANLIVGAPVDDIGGVRAAGLVVQFGTQASGPKASTSRAFHLDSRGVKGKPSRYAQFGSQIS